MRDEAVEKMLDTGRANRYIIGYLNIALEKAEISDEDAVKIERAMYYAFDMFTASEALKKA